MICQVFPRIEGLVLDRFRALGKQVMQHQRAGQSTKLEELQRREVDWAQHQAGINEIDEYLQRLGLVTIQGGRTLTTQGRRYVQAGPLDLRARIARQIT